MDNFRKIVCAVLVVCLMLGIVPVQGVALAEVELEATAEVEAEATDSIYVTDIDKYAYEDAETDVEYDASGNDAEQRSDEASVKPGENYSELPHNGTQYYNEKYDIDDDYLDDAYIKPTHLRDTPISRAINVSQPRLTRFVMLHAGQTITLTNAGQTNQTIDIILGSPFTFEVEIENADIVQTVYVISERYDELSLMEATYDTGRNLWVAEGFFNDDPLYEPGILSVEFSEDISHLFDELEIDFFGDIDFSEVKDVLAPEWQDATVTVDGNVTNIVLDNVEQTEFDIEVETDTINIEIDDLIAQGFQWIEDSNGVQILARMAGDLLDEGDVIEFEVAVPQTMQSRFNFSDYEEV